MKLKRKLLSLLAALAIPLLLCGCVNVRAEEKKLAKALEEEYGEEFVVVDSIVTGGHPIYAGPLRAVCYPKSNKNLLFKATFAEDYIYEDEYVQAIVREEAHAEMKEILSQYYKVFYLDVNVSQPTIEYSERQKYPRFTNISDVSIQSYEEKYGEKMVLSFRVAFNIDEITDYEEVSEIFERYSKKFTDGRINFFCCYMNSDTINECKKLKEVDYWDNFHIIFPKPNLGNETRYVYRFKEGIFYLSEISNSKGIQRFKNDGTLIVESEE